MTDANSTNDPLKPYTNAAGEVVGVIAQRAGTDGDPQVYGATYSGLASTYLGAVGPRRPLGQADVHVLDVLRAVALLASGGVQAQRFRDMISAALAGSVHVEAAVAAVNAARSGQGGPQAAPAPVEEPDDGHGFKPTGRPAHVPETDGGAAEVWNAIGRNHDEDEHQAESDDLDKLLRPVAEPDTKAEAADEDRASDLDLLRWCLDPEADPWADLLEPQAGDCNTGRMRRPGVEPEDVQARFDRLHSLLDTSKAPTGVTKADWQAAQRRVLPSIYGDRGTA